MILNSVNDELSRYTSTWPSEKAGQIGRQIMALPAVLDVEIPQEARVHVPFGQCTKRYARTLHTTHIVACSKL